MSDPADSPENGPDAGAEEAEEEYAPTPFDNPFFLPVVLLAFAVWFIYDGWFNPEMEWLQFNRWGAGITVALGAWFLVRAIRERRTAADGEDAETPGS